MQKCSAGRQPGGSDRNPCTQARGVRLPSRCLGPDLLAPSPPALPATPPATSEPSKPVTSSPLPSPNSSPETPLLLSSRRSILRAQLRGPRFLPAHRPPAPVHRCFNLGLSFAASSAAVPARPGTSKSRKQPAPSRACTALGDDAGLEENAAPGDKQAARQEERLTQGNIRYLDLLLQELARAIPG